MKSVWLYRIAAVFFVLFASGHTFGFLLFRPETAEGRAVWDAMNRVSFPAAGKSFTYGDFYVAFGLDISLYLAFSAFLAWYLSVLARRAPAAAGTLGWGFVLLQGGGLALSCIYFAAPQITFGAIVLLCLAWATASLPKSPPVPRPQPL